MAETVIFPLTEQVNETIKDILQSRFCMIIHQMVQTEMRQQLYQHKMLTDTEYETLLSLTPDVANENLFFMIKKKGRPVFYDFLKILATTADRCPAHVDVYDILTNDLKRHDILYPPYV